MISTVVRILIYFVNPFPVRFIKALFNARTPLMLIAESATAAVDQAIIWKNDSAIAIPPTFKNWNASIPISPSPVNDSVAQANIEKTPTALIDVSIAFRFLSSLVKNLIPAIAKKSTAKRIPIAPETGVVKLAICANAMSN